MGKLERQNLRISDLNWIEESESQVLRCLFLCRISLNPFCTDGPYNRCHSGVTGRSFVITYSLLGSNSNCKVSVNGSLSRLRIVIHVITGSYSRKQAKMTRLNTTFRVSTNTITPTPLNPGIAVSSSVRIDVRSSLRRGRIPAASRRQVLRTCGS